MGRRNTNIPNLLEQERVARKKASSALRDLLSLYSQLEVAGKESDRKSYNDPRYRSARWQFTSFLSKLRGNKRLLMGALGALDGLGSHTFISPEQLIAQVKNEEDAKEDRKKRHARRGTVNAR